MFQNNAFPITLVLFAGTAVFGLTSCGDSARGSNRIPLEGKIVTSSAKPVNGSISLTPAAGTNGVATTASIVEGTYRFTTSNGPEPGKYRVTVILQHPEAAASRKNVPAQKSLVRESFDTNLSPGQTKLDHKLKLE